MGCLPHCSRLQRFAPVAFTPLPQQRRPQIQPSLDCEVWRVLSTAGVEIIQGPGPPDHQMVHIGGVLHFQAPLPVVRVVGLLPVPDAR